ncbi:MAG: hypothetical protein SGBAC_004735 [Bacillariaceae sp.]
MTDKPVQLPFDPQPNDIVCTKLRTWNSKHPGNKFFNAMIHDTAGKVLEENIKTASERLLEVVVDQRGGRFLKLSDVDVMNGRKPHICTLLNRKQCLHKVVRTLKTAHARHNGTLAKRSRNPASRRKKTKEYQLAPGAAPIHPYALQLLGVVMNSAKSTAYRELDKPGDPYVIDTEPYQLRLMRLQLRHRLIGAREAMMPAVEFGHTIMSLWGGRVEVQKIPLPNELDTAEDAAAASTAAADITGSLDNSSGYHTPASPIKAANSTPTTSVPSQESQERKNEAKDLTRNKMKALMNVGGAVKTSPSKAGKDVRGSLASKALPKITMDGGADNKTSSPIKKDRPTRGSFASKTLPNMGGTMPSSHAGIAPPLPIVGGANKMSPSKAVGTKPTRGSPRGKVVAPRVLPVRAVAGKMSTKPKRGSLASKTLPDTSKTVVAAAAAATKAKATATNPSQNIGSLVHNMEIANEDSPFGQKVTTRVKQTGVTSTAAAAAAAASIGALNDQGVSPPPVAPSLGGIGSETAKATRLGKKKNERTSYFL